ncbi:unnamed protein product [Dicrocoelium dendriticum]|nr:unnamed protein product [Dicrocoelium dendriticum]
MSAILLLVALALFKQTAAQNPAVSIRCYDDCGASDGKTCPTVMKGCVACSLISFISSCELPFHANHFVDYPRIGLRLLSNWPSVLRRTERPTLVI